MKLQIILLLISHSAFCQTLTFHSGAGTNPHHIESIGAESGWVEFSIGAMSTPGQILAIEFENWQEIESVSVEYWHSDGFQTVEVAPRAGVKNNFIGIIAAKKNKKGVYGRFSYTVKMKRA